jgi:hypothetical protein
MLENNGSKIFCDALFLIGSGSYSAYFKMSGKIADDGWEQPIVPLRLSSRRKWFRMLPQGYRKRQNDRHSVYLLHFKALSISTPGD